MKRTTARRIRFAGRILFVIYMLLLIYFLFFAESYGRTPGQNEYRYNLIPFREICRYLRYPDVLGFRAVAANLVGNVLGFLPFGAILPVLRRETRSFWKIMLLSFDFSAVVEVTQLITKVGSFDVDDIILNTVGAIIGYLLFVLCNRMRRVFYG